MHTRANLSFFITRLSQLSSLPSAFQKIKAYGAERQVQLEKAALYKEFQVQLMQFKMSYEELKQHTDSLEASKRDLQA